MGICTLSWHLLSKDVFSLVKHQDTTKENVSHHSTHRNKQATDNSTVPLKLWNTGACLNTKTIWGKKETRSHCRLLLNPTSLLVNESSMSKPCKSPTNLIPRSSQEAKGICKTVWVLSPMLCLFTYTCTQADTCTRRHGPIPSFSPSEAEALIEEINQTSHLSKGPSFTRSFNEI